MSSINFAYVKVNLTGTKKWYLNKMLHRFDGPAIELFNGDKFWYQCNKLHRIDGPAIEQINGQKEWFIQGIRHRVDGPAIIWPNGDKEWWVNGQIRSRSQSQPSIKEPSKIWQKEGF